MNSYDTVLICFVDLVVFVGDLAKIRPYDGNWHELVTAFID